MSNYEHNHENKNINDKELKVLINYMVMHNDSHKHQLEEIADKLKDSGCEESYELVKMAIQDFESGNKKLSSALKNLEK